jgi:geranylgeranyl diphosphate synthase, type I
MSEPGLPALKRRVDAELASFVACETEALVAVDAELEPVARQLREAVTAGKRLRAAFCYWGWRATGQPDSDALVRAAAAMELVHAAAVVHDDLIDDSRLRHGRPTAHVALRSAVAGRADSGRAARSLAMLTGDLLMSWAGQMFTTCGLPAAYLVRARGLWAVLARELIAGECLEILRTGREPDTGQSLRVIRYKTAKYTVEHPLHIGGALGGAPDRLLETFTGYGLPLGEAFQLRDDLLGLFGDCQVTGKHTTDDIAGNRPTVLLAEAFRTATRAERHDLRNLLGTPGPDEGQVGRVREIVRRTGAADRVQAMITERVRTATGALAGTRLPSAADRALADLAVLAVERHH